MHAITKTVYIEDQYPGVLLGVIVRPRGLIQVDAPPSPEDGRTWRATLMNLNAGPDRVLINLDAHPDRTLGDYFQKGIAVRVTRANYRTGRLEISAYVPLEAFVRFMEKQAWRVEAIGPEKIPLGSFRLLVPGNPNAINAGLCSGRFPGVFTPFPFTEIYLEKNRENALLYKILDRWLADADVKAQMKQAYLSLAKEWLGLEIPARREA